MDKYSVKLMNRALHDLDDIYGYIAKTFLEPGTAAALAEEIENEIFLLTICPIAALSADTAYMQTVDTGSCLSKTTL